MSTTIGGILLEQRNIVLAEFPYSDLSEVKRRPLLVLSDEVYNRNRQDFICCVITSKPKTKYSVTITNADMEKGILERDSQVRPDKVCTLVQKRIEKIFGKLNVNKSEVVVDTMRDIVGIK